MSTDPSLAHGTPWHAQRTRTVFMTYQGSDASISTTATEANLPGTGRVIGLAYDALGKVIVKRLNRIAYRWQRRSGPPVHTGSGASDMINTSAVQSTLTVSTISTTATESNLPGTGRVIGLAYDVIGKSIEQRLNKLAEKLQRGPDATARKILTKEQQIRKYLHGRPENSEYHDDWVNEITVKDKKLFQRLCKRLLKYSQSNVLSTKLQALTNITNLGLQVPYIYSLLSDLHAVSTLSEVHFDLSAFRDLDPAVRTASERALVVISEVKAATLSLNLRSICDSHEWQSMTQSAKTGISELFSYITDPALSFLVLRLFAAVQGDISIVLDYFDDGFLIDTVLSAILTHIAEVTGSYDDRKSLDVGNWPDLDIVIKQSIEFWGPRMSSQRSYRQVGKLMQIALRYSVFLPKTIEFLISDFAEWWLGAHLHLHFGVTPFYLWVAFEDEFQTLDLYKLSKNELALTTKGTYISDACATLLESLFCPAVLLLRQAVLESSLRLHTMRKWENVTGGILRVVPKHIISSIVTNLLSLLICDDSGTRARTKRALEVVSQRDLYYWSEATRMMRERNYSHMVPPLVYPDRGPFGLHYIFQTRCVNGDTNNEFFNIRQDSHPLKFKVTNSRRQEECRNCHETLDRHDWFQLALKTCDVLWFEVGPNSPFEASMHFPLQVDISEEGETLYLCATERTPNRVTITNVELHAFSASFLKSGALHEYDSIYVFVLRYDPNAYFNTDHYPTRLVEGACYWTGPFFWSPLK